MERQTYTRTIKDSPKTGKVTLKKAREAAKAVKTAKASSNGHKSYKKK
jgi:hypothetical protein